MRNECRQCTTKYILKYEMTKTKEAVVEHGDYSSIAICRKKFPLILSRIFLSFSRKIEICYLLALGSYDRAS